MTKWNKKSFVKHLHYANKISGEYFVFVVINGSNIVIQYNNNEFSVKNSGQ
jgi:hypothetical protein